MDADLTPISELNIDVESAAIPLTVSLEAFPAGDETGELEENPNELVVTLENPTDSVEPDINIDIPSIDEAFSSHPLFQRHTDTQAVYIPGAHPNALFIPVFLGNNTVVRRNNNRIGSGDLAGWFKTLIKINGVIIVGLIARSYSYNPQSELLIQIFESAAVLFLVLGLVAALGGLYLTTCQSFDNSDDTLGLDVGVFTRKIGGVAGMVTLFGFTVALSLLFNNNLLRFIIIGLVMVACSTTIFIKFWSPVRGQTVWEGMFGSVSG